VSAKSDNGAVVFIGVGANLEPEMNIEAAIGALSQEVRITAISTFYRTEPIGSTVQPSYINGVLQALTHYSPRALKFQILRKIEADRGRVRTEDRYAARPIDLDMLLYDDVVIQAEGLELPDPEVRERPFLAAGICEIAPQLLWPGTGEAIAQWASEALRAELRPDHAFTQRLKERFLS